MARIKFNDKKMLHKKQQLLSWLDSNYLYQQFPTLLNKVSFKGFKKKVRPFGE